MNIRGKSVLQLAAVLVASVAMARPALSETSQGHERLMIAPVSRTIDITGYDLSSTLGAQRVYRRIVSAAKALCFSSARKLQGVERARYERRHARPCFDEAVDGALAQVLASTGTDLERVAGLDRLDVAKLVASGY